MSPLVVTGTFHDTLIEVDEIADTWQLRGEELGAVRRREITLLYSGPPLLSPDGFVRNTEYMNLLLQPIALHAAMPYSYRVYGTMFDVMLNTVLLVVY